MSLLVQATKMNIIQCEYCDRSNYLSEGLTCKGCGASPPDAKPAMLVDRRLYNQDNPIFVRPGVNIPINLLLVGKNDSASKWVHFYHEQIEAAKAWHGVSSI
jgi:hypothetical protein